MPTRIVQVDAFTDRPFAGNPAAVCVLAAPRSDSWMRDVAREMNLSETAFLHPDGDGFSLRWFTPTTEVALCGHATLASAHVLWEDGHLPGDRQARFQTRSGILTADRTGDWIRMDFPAKPPRPADAPDSLLAALGSPARFVGRNEFDFLVELESAAAVRSLSPDIAGIARAGARGVIVTAASDDPAFDFVSRFFAPGAGVDEDPVTG